MNATYSILRREFGAYFNTPIGYVFTTAFLLVTCGLFTDTLFIQGLADMRGFFSLLPLFLMFFIPAITMRLWAEERKLGTLELLLTLPVTTWQAVLGKFFAALFFVCVWLVLTAHVPIMLAIMGNPDPGPIIGGYLGTIVLAMIYLSIGAFASSLTSDQIVAFILGVSINFVFFIMGRPSVLAWIKDFSPPVASVVERFGIDSHFDSISRGVVDSRDVIYAVSITALFLFLNVIVLERRR